jgi:glycosyltransferase involved in cell wall biosynthesis
MKLSIIVPVYKVEAYLHRCIDSILAQTFTDYELILVDDGSPDRCPTICDEYAQKDERIKVVHKSNGGLSDARNAGLEIAQGKYIGFIDSDDFIHPQMYEIMIFIAEQDNIGITQCEFYKFDEGGEFFSVGHYDTNNISKKLMTSHELLENYYPSYSSILSTTVCNKVYNASIFDSIRFPVGMYYEDSFVFLDTINSSGLLATINVPLYYYMQRNGSIMHSNYSPKWFQGTYNNNNNNIQFFRNKGFAEQSEYALDDFLTRFSKDKFAVYLLYPQYKYEFQNVEKGFHREFWAILQNPKICRMKKLLAILIRFSPRLALKIAKHYFPECLYEFMR